MALDSISLNAIANIIILISAVIIATKNIYGFLKKPVDSAAAKAKENEKKHIEEVLKAEVPELLEKNCQTIVGAIDQLHEEIADIKEMTIGQEEQLT